MTKEEKRGVGGRTQGDTHGGRGCGGRGDRGCGRYDSHGGRHGHGGRGGDCGRGRGHSARRDISDRFYTDDEWYVLSYEERQNNMVNDREFSREPRDRTNIRSVAALGISQVTNALTDISSTLELETFAAALNSACRISSVNCKICQTMSPEKLANNWSIRLEAAKRTIEKTMQRGIRSVADPSISRRFRTNDGSLRYRRLKTNIFTNTMFSLVISSRESNCVQIYCNDLQWTAIYPMQSKGEAHLSLSSFMSTCGALDFMISDGAKGELTKGEFRRKAREAGVH